MTAPRHNFQPLPPYADPRAALKMALPTLRPAELISVTDAAERHMKVKVGDQWQPFRRDVTPYMTEPTDMIASRQYKGLVFCGPSQSGKTQMLQSAAAWVIRCNPGRLAIFQMTRDAAAEFERNKIAPMIRNSPDLKARQGSGRGADNTYQKLFLGGTQMTLDWPTITKLSSATIRLCMGTDYDHFPDSIDGEGDAYTLMRARTTTFLSRGMVVVESSPGAPVTDEGWTPSSPHGAPPVKYGVLALYPGGTRARWYWPCPHCEERFEPTFARLRYPASADPAEAGEAAEMACPHCGGLFGHALKRELNAAGTWLHETSDGGLTTIDGDVRQTDLLSYWLNGAAAAFSTWAGIVTQFEQARARFETTGDEEALKTALNTGQAMPYLPLSGQSESEVTLEGMREKQLALKIATPKGTAPDWTRFITVCVDTQSTCWDVSAIAWGDDGRHMPIDRFEVHTPPAGAPNPDGRTVKPFDIAEDWAALETLADQVWPVEGAGYGLRAHAIGVDMHGGGNTTENAYRFYRGRKKAGQRALWYLTRGSGGQHSDRVWLKVPELSRQAGKRGRGRIADIEILNMATDRLKDAVASSVRLVEAGQNLCLLPLWMEESQLAQIAAERRGPKGWDKRPGIVRNETLDHLVQARALRIIKRGEKIDPAAPPLWAAGGPENENAVPDADTGTADAAPRPVAAPVQAARKTGRIRYLAG